MVDYAGVTEAKRREGMFAIELPFSTGQGTMYFNTQEEADQAKQRLEAAGSFQSQTPTAIKERTAQYTPQTGPFAGINFEDFQRNTQEQNYQIQSIETLAKQDYELGRLTIIRKYTDGMKIVEASKQAGKPEMAMALAEEFGMEMRIGLSELRVRLDNAKNTFKRIGEDRNYDSEQGLKLETDWYLKHRVFTPPKKEEKSPYQIQAEIQDIESQVSGMPEAIQPQMRAALYHEKGFPQPKAPEGEGSPLAQNTIDNYALAIRNRVKKGEGWWGRNPSKEEIVDRAKTAIDMDNMSALNLATKKAIFSTIDNEFRNMEETKSSWDEDIKKQIAEYLRIVPTAGQPQKLLGSLGGQMPEPKTADELIINTRNIKDRDEAKAYYEKWMGKF